jgi:hypothetical protein
VQVRRVLRDREEGGVVEDRRRGEELREEQRMRMGMKR